MGWLTDIFVPRRPPPPSDIPRDQILPGFDALLAERLAAMKPMVKAAFDAFDPATLPEGVACLHVEVFDDAGYTMRVFDFSTDGSLYYADFFTLTPDTALDALNAELDRHQPFITEDDLNRFTLWEPDGKGWREAQDQPLDSYRMWQRIGPFIAEVSEGMRHRIRCDFTSGMHDRPQPRLSLAESRP